MASLCQLYESAATVIGTVASRCSKITWCTQQIPSFWRKVKKCLSTNKVISSDSVFRARNVLLCPSFVVPRGFSKSSVLFISSLSHHSSSAELPLQESHFFQINATLSAPPRILVLLYLALTGTLCHIFSDFCHKWSVGDRAISLTGYYRTSILFYLTIYSVRGGLDVEDCQALSQQSVASFRGWIKSLSQ